MITSSMLLWGLLFGSTGLGYFIYGRKQKAPLPLLCGLGLMVVPYFLSNVVVLLLTGILLIVLPMVIRV